MRSKMARYLKGCLRLWKAICYSGLIHSVVMYSVDYLARNEVTSGVLIDLPFPSVSFCIQNPSLVKPGTPYFDAILRSCSKEIDTHCYDELLKSRSDEVFDSTFDLSEIFLDQVFYGKEKLTKYAAKSYMTKFFKCAMYTFDEAVNAMKGLHFTIKDTGLNGQLLVYLTSRGLYPRGLQLPFQFIRDFQKGYFDWKYSHFSQVKLRAPYPDNCFDYKEWNLDDQDHCLERCIYEANDRVMPYVFSAVPGDNFKFGNMTSLYSKTCFEKCSRRSCHEVNYAVESDRVIPSNVTTISLRRTEKTIVVEYRPHITFRIYIIYMAGLLNTWFGFYMFSLDLAVYRFLRKQGRCQLKFPTRFVISLLLSLVCYALCALQIWRSAASFLRYTTQSEVYLGPLVSSVVRIPDMSICFELKDVLDEEQLTKRSLCIGHGNGTYRTQCQDELNDRSFKDIDDLSYKMEQLIYEMTVWSPTHQISISSENSSSVSYAMGAYFKGRDKCLKLDISRLYRELEPDYERKMHLSATAMVQVFLNKISLPDPSTTVRIYLHSDGMYPFGLYQTALETRLDEYETLVYTYSAITLLTAPFKSNCYDYRADKSQELVSQQDCIEKCWLKYSGFRTCQAVVTEPMLKHTYLDNHELSGSIVDRCERKCSRPDCFAVGYRVQAPLKSFISDGWAFLLTMPTYVFESKMTPNMKCLELILYIASVSGFWFNFNLLAMVKQASNKWAKIRKKRNGATRWRSRRRVRRCLILAFLSFGFALHSFFTLVMYFERNTVTYGTIADAEEIQLPGMTICFHFAVSLNRSYLLSRACSDMVPGFYCDDEVAQYSPSEMQSGSKQLKDLMSKLEIRKADGKSWDTFSGQSLADLEAEITEVTYLFSFKCFTLNWNREFDFKRLEYNEESMQVARLSGMAGVPVILFLHPIGFPVRKNAFSAMTTLITGEHRRIAYMPMTRILLPSPYEPTCTPYSDITINCQAACLDECRQSMTKKHFNHSAANFIRYSNDTFKPARRIGFYETSEYCLNHCLHPECESTSLNVVRISSESDNNYLATVIALRWEINVQYFPRMKFLDLVIYMGGLFGLWFGIAYVSLLKDFLNGRFMRIQLGRFKANRARNRRNRVHASVYRFVHRTKSITHIGDHKIT
ncbi:hypothetical protein HDE_01740 [Halotydeus destructor]|nr:hypothetical protein HDE_01740 [Halotydeus destructor]